MAGGVGLGAGDRCLGYPHGVLLLVLVSDLTVAWSFASSLSIRSKSAEVGWGAVTWVTCDGWLTWGTSGVIVATG